MFANLDVLPYSPDRLGVLMKYHRTPKNYDGTAGTCKQMQDLLPKALCQIGEVYKERPDLIIAAWPELMGKSLAPMTQAISFVNGVLTVKVKNSTLYSLLSQHEKPKLLKSLREKFPNVIVNNIVFRIG